MTLLSLQPEQFLFAIIIGIPVLIVLIFFSIWLTRYIFKIDLTLEKQDEIIRLLKKLANEND